MFQESGNQKIKDFQSVSYKEIHFDFGFQIRLPYAFSQLCCVKYIEQHEEIKEFMVLFK